MQTLNQKFANLIHRHPWALQTALAVFIAVMAVGYTAHQQTNAQVSLGTINYPTYNEQLLLDSRYKMQYTIPISGDWVEFSMKKGSLDVGSGTSFRDYLDPNDGMTREYIWNIQATINADLLTGGSNPVTLIAKVSGTEVARQAINIWKPKQESLTLDPIGFDWSKPVKQSQVLGSDQKLLQLKWVGGAIFPDNTTTSTFYDQVVAGVIYYDSASTFKTIGLLSNILSDGKEFLWTVPDDFRALRKLEIKFSVYSNGRGLPLVGADAFSSQNTMQSGTFMNWLAPSATTPTSAEVVHPSDPYQLKWQLTDAANPPTSNLITKIYWTYADTNKGFVDKALIFQDVAYGKPGVRPITIPTGAKVGGNIMFTIETFYPGKDGALFSAGDNAFLHVEAPVAPATAGVIQVIKPSVGETLTNGELYTDKIQWKFTELPNPSGTTGGTIKYFLVPAGNPANTGTPVSTLIGTDTLGSIKLNTIYAYSYWTINVPETQLPGQFKIKVQYIPNDPEVAPLTEGIGGEFTISAVQPQVGTIEVFQPALNEQITSNGQRYDKIQWRFTTLPPLTGAKGGVIEYYLIKAETPATISLIGTDSSLVGKDPVLGASYAYSSWVVSPVETTGQYAIRVRYIPSNGTAAVEDSSDEFIINPAPVVPPRPISATYYSAPIDLTSGGTLSPTSISALVADEGVNYHQPTGSLVRFSLGFFKKVGTTYISLTPVGNSGFDSEGYLVITDDSKGNLGFIAQQFTSWFPQLTHIRIRIEMSTPDFNNTALQPWVQSVTLSYDAERTAGQIGYVEFVVDPDTNPTKIEPGTSVDIAFTVTPMNDFAGEVMLGIGDITKDMGNPDTDPKITSISGQFNPATITISGTAPVFGTIRLTAASVPLDEGLYNFTIGGFKVGQPDLVLASATGHLFVGEVVPTESFTISAIGDITVAPGGQAQYTITATRIASYTGTITFATDIVTKFGDKIASAIFNPTSITFGSADTDLEKTTILTVLTDSNAADAQNIFRITGTDASIVVSTDEPKLTISSDVTTLNVTIPLEAGTYPTYTEYFSNLAAHPIFSLRVYTDGEEGAAGTMVATTTGFHTDTSNQSTVVISELPTGTYRVFARTTRHLWKHATDKLVVTPDQTTYALEWDAAGLPAGDLDGYDDNVINLFDASEIINTIGDEGVGLLTNLDNDEGVTIFDINYILGMFNGTIAKFLMSGDWLPDVDPPAGN